MKLTIITLILSFFLLPQFSFAQSWEWQHPKPQGHDLSAVFFLDTETGWAYGDYGTIIKTEDGGQNWVLQDTPTKDWIYLLFFKDKDHGWAYTFEGEVLYTEDKGENWTILYTSEPYVLDAHFFNSDTGIIVGYDENIGGQILRTEDGGLNWDTTFTLPNRGIGRLSFVNDTIGWAGGEDGLIIYTENGGLDWVEQNSGTDLDLLNISFVDEQHGWTAGDQYLNQATETKLFYTSDGGVTWSQQTVLQDVEVSWMKFVNEDDGYLLGSVLIEFHGIHVISAIFQTFDGGTTWSSMDFGIDEFLYRGFINEDQDIWLVGENSRILHSSDNGATWTNQIVLLATGLHDVQFLNLNEGWATGLRALLHTVNGGQDWQAVMTDTFTDYWASLSFPDNQNGWVAGDILIHTSNGGQDWEEQILPAHTYDNKVFFTSPTDGWIVGNSQYVLSTTNGGQDWKIHDFPGLIFKDLHFVNSQIGWVVGGNYIVSTTDGGQNWSTYEIADIWNLRSVHFLDSLNGWVLTFGGSGLYYQTQDGGQTWEEHTIPGASFMLDVYFVSANIGWIVGTSGNIWYTEDGGDSWTWQDAGTDVNLFDIHAVDEANAWTVGLNGAILKYTGIHFPTSVAPVTLDDDLMVFPNPAYNEINIIVPGPISRYDAEIRSYTGQLIKSFWVVSQNTTIPLEGIPTGVYILNLIDSEKQFSKKIIIVKE